MNRILQFSVLAAVLALGPIASAAPGTNIPDGSPLAPAGAPRSSFTNEPGEPGFGKDPFYPKSTRITRSKVVVAEEEIIVVPDFPPELVLKGVSFVAGKKLAIINYQTVAEQEEFSIKVDGKTIKGQCVEIKEKSALIKVNTVTKEIPLRIGLQ